LAVNVFIVHQLEKNSKSDSKDIIILCHYSFGVDIAILITIL